MNPNRRATLRRLSFATVLLWTVPSLSGCGDDSSTTPGAQAPAARVELTDAAALEAKIAAHRGRGLLVNLWAMW